MVWMQLTSPWGQGFTAKLLFVTDLSYFCFINIIDVSKCLPLNEAPETAVEPVRETRLCLKSMLILKMLFLHRKAKHFCLILLLCADFHTRFSSYAVFKRCSYDWNFIYFPSTDQRLRSSSSRSLLSDETVR